MVKDAWLFKLNNEIFDGEDTCYNLYGDYTYLLEGYYKSLDYYLNDINVHPTPQECLDAYVVALAMEKAKLNNINIPEYYIVTDKTKIEHFPVIGYAMNPFSTNSYIIENLNYYKHKIKSLTLSGRYFALIQKLPLGDYRLDTIRLIFGHTQIKEYKELAMSIFKVFKIPLMKVKIIVTSEIYLFSAIEPLNYESLSINEKKFLEGLGQWQE